MSLTAEYDGDPNGFLTGTTGDRVTFIPDGHSWTKASGTATTTGWTHDDPGYGTYLNLTGGVPRCVGTWQPIAATSGTDTACTNGTAYVGLVYCPRGCTITGIQYLIGSVGGTDKVIVSLHSLTGALLANSDTAGVTVGTAANAQQVAFTSTYVLTNPAHLWLALTFNGTTAKFRSVPAHCQVGSGLIGNGVTQTFGTPAAFTAPTTFTADKVPVMSLY